MSGKLKISSPTFVIQRGKRKTLDHGPNVSDPNERPLGCRTQTSVTLGKEASC
jgi:hypothetical protein